MSGQLDGKVAVVTGSGRGVGRAYAHALAAEGAAVVVNDLADGGSPAADVVREIEAAGGRAVANTDSVSDFAGAKRIMDTTVERFGRLDVLVANAGIMRPVRLDEASEGDWADLLSVHANGTFNCLRHAAPLMRERGGTILTTGDITTDLYFPQLAAYRAAKAAIAVLTLHAAHELHEHGVNVNSIMPGATATRMQQQFYASLEGRRDGFLSAVRDRYEDEDQDKGGAAHGPAAPESVPPLGVYLCTDAGRAVTGRLFQMHGTDVRVVVSHTEISYLSPEGDGWSIDELAARVPAWLADVPAEVA